MANSQHRCVFVGNIPYDATEEQLKQICEEVGPVVSFRLVIDRETGKPKGYGFCEYKDEETALSARRNLQGYDINGRQLRVDFAENDKNAEKPRDQGRGGPGMVANAGPSKQFGGPAIVLGSSNNQPIGLTAAMEAASFMAEVLGGAQVSRESYPNGFQGQPDPLTLHLAKMSRNQLNDVLSELKVMATGNKEQARQLLLATPQLSKAFFQAQIMLGMVPQQMLKMPNIRQTSGPPMLPLSHDGQQSQQQGVQALSGLPPLSQNNLQSGLMPRVQEPQLSSLHPNSMAHNQFSAAQQHSLQPKVPLPQLAQNQVGEQVTLPGHSTTSSLPLIGSHPFGGRFARPETPIMTSSYVQQQMQPPSFQQQGPTGSTNSGRNSHPAAPNAAPGSSLLARVPLSSPNIQVGRVDSYPSSHLGSIEKANMLYDTADPMNRPSKMIKLEGGKSANTVGSNVPGTSQVSSSASFGNRIPRAEDSNSEKQIPQLQIPPEVESALLQQVLNLTPEQVSSLPPDQQQQVLQLQQMLR